MNRRIFYIILSLAVTFSIFVAGCSGGAGGIGDMSEPDPMPPFTVTPIDDGPTGTIEGTVRLILEDEDTIPAAGAFISLIDQAISTYADDDGEFILENVWAGERLMIVTAGSAKASGSVTVEEGKTTVMTIEMPYSPSTEDPGDDPAPDPEPDTGNLTIITYGLYDAEYNWVGVNYIRVWEYGNYSNRWYASWADLGNEGKPSYELTCYNAEKYKYYVVEIQWYDGYNQQTDTIYLYLDNQSEFITRY